LTPGPIQYGKTPPVRHRRHHLPRTGNVTVNQKATTLARNASTAVIFPIAGLLGGLFIGGLRARGRGPHEFAQIECVVKWGVTGFFAGLALVVLLVFASWRQNLISMRKLMVLVVVAGVLTWFFSRVLSTVLSDGGY
jgi:hypothetical protein